MRRPWPKGRSWWPWRRRPFLHSGAVVEFDYVGRPFQMVVMEISFGGSRGGVTAVLRDRASVEHQSRLRPLDIRIPRGADE